MSFSVKFNDQDVFEAIANLRKGVPMPDSMLEYCERDPAKAIMVALNRGARWLEVEQSIIDYALNFSDWGFSRSIVAYCTNLMGGRWSELEDSIKSQTQIFLHHDRAHFGLIVSYCNEVIKGRWVAIEQNIKDPRQITEYAYHVIKGRWQEKEPEVLKDVNSAQEYCNLVVRERWEEFEKKLLDTSSQSRIVQYSTMYGRFHEAEIYITEPEHIINYAISVIGGRWKEKESIIAKSPRHAFFYAQEVIKGPFPEAEKLLLDSPWYFDYFTFATKAFRSLASQLSSQFPPDMTVGELLKIIDDGRNLDFEKKLLSSTHNQSKAVWYAVNVLKGRWPEMEQKIKKSAKSSVEYARDVIKGRWEEAESCISKNEKYLSVYGVEVIKGKLPDVLHNKMITAAMRNSKDRNIKRYFEMLENAN
jgi:hypothetical protein